MIADAPLSRVLLVRIIVPCAYRALLDGRAYRILTDPLPSVKTKKCRNKPQRQQHRFSKLLF